MSNPDSAKQKRYTDKKKREGWQRKCVWVPPYAAQEWELMITAFRKKYHSRYPAPVIEPPLDMCPECDEAIQPDELRSRPCRLCERLGHDECVPLKDFVCIECIPAEGFKDARGTS